MSREVRIIDGVPKVVKVVDGKIVKIIKDYKKPIIDDYKREEYIKREIEERISEEHWMRQIRAREFKINNEIEKNEVIHEIHHGKRYRYQKEEKIEKGPSKYLMEKLRHKAITGIIDKEILNIKSSKKLLDNWAGKKGFNNYDEYLNVVALGRGFTCYGEYEKVWMYYPEMPIPIKENRKDPRFIGIYIAENGIAKIYEGSQRMPYFNPGYDIICPKGHKIDVKATVLNRYNMFNFRIDQNKIADYFVLVAFNNIIELKPLHLWIVKGDEDIYGNQVNNMSTISILNEPKYLGMYEEYEKIDKLKKLKILCEDFDAKNKIEMDGYNTQTKSAMLDIILELRLEGYSEILPTDILHILEKKKKETINDRVKLVPDEDVI